MEKQSITEGVEEGQERGGGAQALGEGYTGQVSTELLAQGGQQKQSPRLHTALATAICLLCQQRSAQSHRTTRNGTAPSVDHSPANSIGIPGHLTPWWGLCQPQRSRSYSSPESRKVLMKVDLKGQRD